MKTEKYFRIFFTLAAAYNIIWGIVIILFPNLMFQIFNITPINYPFLMSGIGMFVGVYGYGYCVVAREPRRYPQLIIIGLLGKVLGPIGWVYHVWLRDIPSETLLINLFNDIIWLPGFFYYLYWYRKEVGNLFESPVL